MDTGFLLKNTSFCGFCEVDVGTGGIPFLMSEFFRNFFVIKIRGRTEKHADPEVAGIWRTRLTD